MDLPSFNPHPLALATLLAFAPPTPAQGVDAGVRAPGAVALFDPDQPARLGPVVVTATRNPLSASATPASVSVVGPDSIERHAPVRLGDALADVPGVYLRGAAFGAAPPASGQAVLTLRGIPRSVRTLVMIDGHPINNALSGGFNVASLVADQLERIEVVRGPYSALYGGNAMGGVINLITADPDRPLALVRAGIGNLGQRAAAVALRQRFDGGLGVTLSAGWRESAGYPDSDEVVKTSTAGAGAAVVNGARPTTTADGTPAWSLGNKGPRPWTQHHADLGLHWRWGSATRVTIGASRSAYDVGYAMPNSALTDAAGNPVFSGAVSPAGTTGTRLSLAATDWFTPTPSGESDERLYARLAHRFDDGTQLALRLGLLRHRFTFSQATAGRASYAEGPGEVTEQPNRRLDLELSLRRRFSPTWALTGGVSLNRGELDRRTATLPNWRDQDIVGATTTAAHGRSDAIALFGQVEHRLTDALTGYLGARVDRFETRGSVSQATAPAFAVDYPKHSFSQTSPKAALVWQLSPAWSLRGSYGEAFRPPALLDLYSRTVVPSATAGTVAINEASPDLRPERVKALEVGADWQGAHGARFAVTLYRQQLSELIYRRRLSSTLTRTENAARADVDGIEAQAVWPVGGTGLRVLAMVGHHFRYDITENPAVPDSVGKRLTDVPRTTASLTLEGERGPFSGYVGVRHVSQVFGSGDDLNRNTASGVYGAYDAVTLLSARLAWRLTASWEASVSGDNLANRKYYAFGRQPGRTVFAQIAHRW